MKLQKHEVCVSIENEAQLQEARELLEKYEEKIFKRGFGLSKILELNYLFCDLDLDWWLSNSMDLIQITLSQLETILKDDNNG